MHLVFLGPPGAGKGTQSETICRALGIPKISTGDLIRASGDQDSGVAGRCREYSESGRLVPDQLVNRIVEDRLREPDCSQGFLLDGYPRTIAQAETLDRILRAANEQLDHVLLLVVDEKLIYERITGRRVDPETGHSYHLTYNPPPPELAKRVVQRADDRKEVIEKRLLEYNEKTKELEGYYLAAGLLRRIDGVGSRDTIKTRIFSAMRVAPTNQTTATQ